MRHKTKSRTRKDDGDQVQVAPDLVKNSLAANMLGFKQVQHKKVSQNNKTRNRAIDAGKLQRKSKARKYTEAELGVPKLNTALNPAVVKIRGKKGKKFVNDASLAYIIADVQRRCTEKTASKLERDRYIESIREAKQQELEEQERKKKEKLERAKKEVLQGSKKRKSSAKTAPATVVKGQLAAPRAKTVSFA